MTAQPFMPTSPLVGTPRNPKSAAGPTPSLPATAAPARTPRSVTGPAATAPAGTASAPMAPVPVLEAAQAPDCSLLARIWNAYRARRNAARMRNIAQDMEPHMLDDVGAPQWLINEASVRRDLSRLRHVDYIRW